MDLLNNSLHTPLDRKQVKKLRKDSFPDPAPDKKVDRDTLRILRMIWAVGQTAQTMSPTELRRAIDTKAPWLPRGIRQLILNHLQVASPPDDPRFWTVVQDLAPFFQLAGKLEAEAQCFIQEKPLPDHYHWFFPVWQRIHHEFFHCMVENFEGMFVAKYGSEPPREWRAAAERVLNVVSVLVSNVKPWLNRRAAPYRRLWEHDGRTEALLFAIQRGFIQDEWIGRTIASLQFRRIAPASAPEEQQQADMILQAVGRAISAGIGKGTSWKLPASTRKKHRAVKNYEYGARRNHRQAAERLVRKVSKEEEWQLKKGRTLQQARREAVRLIEKEFKATSRAQDKDAILSIFKEILHKN